LLVVGGEALAMLAFIFFGYQLRDLDVIMAGVLFLSSLVVDDVLTDGKYLRSPGSFAALSFGYWLSVWVLSAVGGVGDLQFSFLSAPTQSGGYLSALSGASAPVQAFVNRWAAPIYETLLKVSITYVAWHLSFKLLNRYLPAPIAVIVALVPAVGMFAGMHGLRSKAFYAAAFVVAMVMLAPLYLEDYLPGNQTWLIPMSVAGVFGIHRAINIQQGDGYLTFVSDMLQAEPPMLWANWIALFIELVTFVAAVWFAGKLVVRVGTLVADVV
jgi:hypothetical protein